MNGSLGFPHSSAGKESACSEGDLGSIPGSGRSLERGSLPTPVFLGFLCGSAGKESACTVGHLGLIPGLGRSSGERKGYPLQYSCLENSMVGGAWRAIVLGGRKESHMTEFTLV